ncbi:hypothetical protein [Nocardioides sp. GXZ039]|uniref:hypothetical protein n=1 Tax=Nocardioides sp. GXZ039 TaxID=3136018 RepID=UPI0030F4AAB9
MKQPDEFDAFYVDARERLLVQTYALTGDLAASRKAVRDAFVVGWQRWRKLSRRERPEDVVGPHAWRLAQRRHSAKVWHREKDIHPEVREILDALGKLSTAQRKAVVLTQLAAVSMPQMAREVGLPLERAERELQSGVAALSLALDVEGSELRSVFDVLAASVQGRTDEATRFPRSTIVRRAGNARGRAHTLAGVLATVGVLVASGAVVTDAAGVRPTLFADDPSTPAPDPTTPPVDHTDVETEVEMVLPDTALLSPAQLAEVLPGKRTWTAGRTTDNSTGNGLVMPCQTTRYADPHGTAALVRTFKSSDKGQPAATLTEFTEASAKPRAARRAFRATTSWFARCTEPRMQLLATRTPTRVGDEVLQVVLRSASDPVTTYVVGISRTGLLTTTTMLAVASADATDAGEPAASAGLLARAVGALCALPGGGACAPPRPRVEDRAPLPVGRQPALISELDLPPVDGVDEAWVGTRPKKATTNAAATSCDQTSFTGKVSGAPFTRNTTRTFLIPTANLPREFGVTETVGALPRPQAIALVDRVRDQLASCETRKLNTTIERLTDQTDARAALTAWRINVKVPGTSWTFHMAILRSDHAVGQLTLVEAKGAAVSDEDFIALARRAQERLGEMPPPGGR